MSWPCFHLLLLLVFVPRVTVLLQTTSCRLLFTLVGFFMLVYNDTISTGTSSAQYVLVK